MLAHAFQLGMEPHRAGPQSRGPPSASFTTFKEMVAPGNFRAYCSNMLAKALIAAILGLSAQFAVLVTPLVGVLARYPHARIDASNLLFAAAVSLIPTGALIVFFAALLREVQALGCVEARQFAALSAAFGQALQLSRSMWFAWRFEPYDPARHWVATIVSQVLPALLWLALLLVFWKETTPANNRLTRLLATVLCVLTGVTGIRGSYLIAECLSRVTVVQAAYALSWVSLAVLLVVIYKTCGKRTEVSDTQGWLQ